MIALLASAAKVEPWYVGTNPIAYLLLAVLFVWAIALLIKLVMGD